MKKVISIIKASKAAYLATVDSEGKPEIRALLNLPNSKKYKSLDGKALLQDGDKLIMYFTTNTSSNKVARIRNNHNVALYFCEPNLFQGICVSGTMEEVTDTSVKENFWQRGWKIYYPLGKTDPDYTLLKFTSTKIEGWYDFGIHRFGDKND